MHENHEIRYEGQIGLKAFGHRRRLQSERPRIITQDISDACPELSDSIGSVW